MRFVFATLALLLSQMAPAPAPALTAPAKAPDTARNLADFDFVVSTIASNYAGYPSKTAGPKAAELQALTARLRTRAAAASSTQLTAILKEWVAFFHDGHTHVDALGTAGAATPTPRLAWSETRVRARLAALGAARDAVEGIWQIGDRYRLAVLRTGKAATRFAAVILTTTADGWQPGDVKADLTAAAPGLYHMVYRAGDHAEHPVTAWVLADGAVLDLGSEWGSWNRALPAVADADADRAARLFPAAQLLLKRLSPKTLWLRIPDFNDSRARPLAELLAAHQADLAAMPNLVIDLRNNGGGSDYVYAPILPLLYSRPVVSIGMEMRASADNIALRRAIAEKIRAEAPGPAQELDAQNRLMAAHIGDFVRTDPLPFSIERRAAVLPFPRHIAVLIDHAASTGEQFLLDARQSR